MFEWMNLSLNDTYPIPLETFDAIPIVFYIINVVFYIIICIGNLSIIGISHYEKYGQDPQKRSFTDQVFGFGLFVFVVINFISSLLVLMRSFIGPMGNIPALVYFALYSVLLALPLSFAESIIFKCLLIFFWKRFAALDDDFFALFFNVFNFLIIGFGITAIRLMTGEFQRRIDYDFWSGIELVDET